MTPLFTDRPGSIRVKICGLTSPEDASAAIRFGADALGFNFWEHSKRFIAPDSALPWIGSLDGPALKVAVLVNPEIAFVERLAGHPAIDAIQFHGDESPDFIAAAAGFGKPLIKAISIRAQPDLARLDAFACNALLIDSAAPGQYGGTGTAGEWGLAARAVREHPGKAIFLAGGLTPGTVAAAIRQVRPFGVDVASGVEADPGIKDLEKMEVFLRVARETARSFSQ
jgi:phosphoribosylanthranilate isomerase